MSKNRISLLIFLSFWGTFTYASPPKDFEKAFGKSRSVKKQVSILVVFKNNNIGNIETVINEKGIIESFHTESFLKILSKIMDSKYIPSLEKLTHKNGFISSKSIRKSLIELKFDKNLLILFIDFPYNLTKKSKNQNRSIPEWAINPVLPLKHSGYINYSIRENIIHDTANDNSNFEANFDSALKFNKIVIENFSQYNSKYGFKRDDFRAVYDNDHKALRYIVGDLKYDTIGYGVNKNLAGISLTKNNTLKPYETVTPVNDKEYILRSTSYVNFFINDVLIKSDILKAGRHSIEDIPLNNGLNIIKIIAKDSLSKITTYNFRQNSSTKLLGENKTEYSFVLGVPYEDEVKSRKYDKYNEGPNISLFYKQGISNNFTFGAITQLNKLQAFIGPEIIYSSPFGSFIYESSLSSIYKSHFGQAIKLTYEFLTSTNLYNHKNFIFSGEYRTRFNSSFNSKNPNNSQKITFRSGYGQNISTKSSINLNGNYSTSRDEIYFDNYGIDITLGKRVFKSVQGNLLFGRSRDRFKKWQSSIYLFFNFRIPNSNQNIHTIIDSKNHYQKLEWQRNSSKPVNDFSTRAGISNSKSIKKASVNIEYTNQRFVFETNQLLTKKRSISKKESKTSLQFASAFLFTSNGINVSKPIAGSFALLKQVKDLKGKKLALNGNFDHALARTDSLGAIPIANLNPYNYFKLHIDNSELPLGTFLEKEEYVLFPTYRSGHLLEIGKENSLTIRGQLLTINKESIALATGTFINIETKQKHLFFTNRNGVFTIENIIPGKYVLSIDNIIFNHSNFMIKDEANKILDIGSIMLRKK